MTSAEFHQLKKRATADAKKISLVSETRDRYAKIIKALRNLNYSTITISSVGDGIAVTKSPSHTGSYLDVDVIISLHATGLRFTCFVDHLGKDDEPRLLIF